MNQFFLDKTKEIPVQLLINDVGYVYYENMDLNVDQLNCHNAYKQRKKAHFFDIEFHGFFFYKLTVKPSFNML